MLKSAEFGYTSCEGFPCESLTNARVAESLESLTNALADLYSNLKAKNRAGFILESARAAQLAARDNLVAVEAARFLTRENALVKAVARELAELGGATELTSDGSRLSERLSEKGPFGFSE